MCLKRDYYTGKLKRWLLNGEVGDHSEDRNALRLCVSMRQDMRYMYDRNHEVGR